jgi:hypothetical protein
VTTRLSSAAMNSAIDVMAKVQKTRVGACISIGTPVTK